MTAVLAARTKVFYGWWVVASLGVIMFLSAGFGFYAIGVFITPLQDAFGWTRGQVSVAMALATLFNGFSGPFVGLLTNRFGARAVLGGGAVVMGLAFALLSLTWSLYYLYMMFIVMGIGQAGVMLIPAGTVVSNWFRRRRGLAVGLTTAGIGLGGLVMAPVAALLIDGLGWRATFLIMGFAIACVVVPLAVFVIQQHPRERGLSPDGDAEQPAAEGRSPVTETDGAPVWAIRRAVRTRAFLAVAVAFSLAMATVGAVLIHMVPFLEDRGIAREQAGLMLGFVSGMGAVGKVTSGYLADRLSPRVIVSAVFALLAVGLVILVQMESTIGMVAFTLVFGYSMGSCVALQPLMVVYCFGLASVATMLGTVVAIGNIVNAFGPMLAGLAYDLTDTYRPVFLVFAAVDCLAAAAVFLFGHPPAASDGRAGRDL